MTEWIAAECHGSVVRVLEDLLLRCASAEGFRESRFEVIDMNVQVHRRPMTFVVPRLPRVTGSFGAGAPLEQADFSISGTEYDHAR